MPWPTWEQAAIAMIVSLLAHVSLRRRLSTDASGPRESAAAFTRELAIIAGLYGFWRVAKHLPFDRYDGAFERALQIVDFQELMGLPSELAAQDLITAFAPLAWLSSAYYVGMHVPATIACLVWLFVRHRDRYGVWRDRLALLTLFCMLIRFVHVAPPRFFPELGFVDVAAANGMDVYGPVGTGVSAQTVAMPSIHVAWAGWVAFAAIACSPSRWRWLVAMHLPITLFVVAATGHHWWLDGIVAVALLGAAVVVERSARAGWRALASAVERRRDGGGESPPVTETADVVGHA